MVGSSEAPKVGIALHCVALHCIALHCVALHCVALRCVALHCIALALLNEVGAVLQCKGAAVDAVLQLYYMKLLLVLCCS